MTTLYSTMGISEALSDYETALEWSNVFFLSLWFILSLALVTSMVIAYLRKARAYYEPLSTTIVVVIGGIIFNMIPSVVVLFWVEPMIIGDEEEVVIEVVAQQIEENIDATVREVNIHEYDVDDPQHVKDARLVVDLTFQQNDSAFVMDSSMVYDEDHDVMYPADFQDLQSLTVVDGSPLAELVSQDGYDGELQGEGETL